MLSNDGQYFGGVALFLYRRRGATLDEQQERIQTEQANRETGRQSSRQNAHQRADQVNDPFAAAMMMIGSIVSFAVVVFVVVVLIIVIIGLLEFSLTGGGASAGGTVVVGYLARWKFRHEIVSIGMTQIADSHGLEKQKRGMLLLLLLLLLFRILYTSC